MLTTDKGKTMGAVGKLRGRRAQALNRVCLNGQCLVPPRAGSKFCEVHSLPAPVQRVLAGATEAVAAQAAARAELLSITRNLIEALEVLRPSAALVKRARRVLDAARLDPL